MPQIEPEKAEDDSEREASSSTQASNQPAANQSQVSFGADGQGQRRTNLRDFINYTVILLSMLAQF